MHEKDKNVRKDILPPRTCLVKPFSAPSWRSWCYFFRFFSKRQKKFQAAFLMTFLRDGTTLLCSVRVRRRGFAFAEAIPPAAKKVRPHRCSVKGASWGTTPLPLELSPIYPLFIPKSFTDTRFIPSPVRRKTWRKCTFRHIVFRGERSCHLGQAPKNVYAQK